MIKIAANEFLGCFKIPVAKEFLGCFIIPDNLLNNERLFSLIGKVLAH